MKFSRSFVADDEHGFTYVLAVVFWQQPDGEHQGWTLVSRISQVPGKTNYQVEMDSQYLGPPTGSPDEIMGIQKLLQRVETPPLPQLELLEDFAKATKEYAEEVLKPKTGSVHVGDKATIGELPMGAIYKRKDGGFWCKDPDSPHHPVQLARGGLVTVSLGEPEPFDPNEEVEVVLAPPSSQA